MTYFLRTSLSSLSSLPAYLTKSPPTLLSLCGANLRYIASTCAWLRQQQSKWTTAYSVYCVFRTMTTISRMILVACLFRLGTGNAFRANCGWCLTCAFVHASSCKPHTGRLCFVFDAAAFFASPHRSSRREFTERGDGGNRAPSEAAQNLQLRRLQPREMLGNAAHDLVVFNQLRTRLSHRAHFCSTPDRASHLHPTRPCSKAELLLGEALLRASIIATTTTYS